MSKTLKEAERLYKLGFAILWLKPKSKAPVKSKWTTGPRESWAELKSSYRPGFNMGVRLGTPSKLPNGFLAVIDIDVKSVDARHRLEAENAVRDLFPEIPPRIVQVMSGRGNGSSHIYIVTDEPSTPQRVRVSNDKVKVHMPSASVSQAQRDQLSEEELNEGFRIRPAWEISVMGDGQQVVLPPSLHPDSGKEYVWKEQLSRCKDLITLSLKGKQKKLERTATNDFKAEDVDVFTTLPAEIAAMIIEGDGVEDRSAALFKVTIAMIKALFTDQQIMSVLTNQTFMLGCVAYEHAKTDSRERAANWIFNYTIKKARLEVDARYQFDSECEDVTLSPEEAKAQAAELTAQHDWKSQIERTIQGPNMGRPKVCLKNVLLILRNEVSPAIFKRDLFSNRDSYGCHAPWGGKPDHAISDDDLHLMKDWFTHRFRFEPDQGLIAEAVSIIALKNAYHPVRDYLEGLVWDGTARVDTWLKTYIQAEAPEPYLSDVSRKIIVAMIARVFVPGTKFDHIPVLEGLQGVGKSSAARILASDQWFSDNLPDLRHADARLNLQGKWIVEMGELASLKRSDMESIKAYVTSSMDRVRAPYGRKPFDLKRQSIFIGTTNQSNYLKDKTGNRRFWPIPVHQCDFKKLTEDRDQLFAEAYILWVNFGEPLYLEGLSKIQAEKLQSERIQEDEESVMETMFLEFLSLPEHQLGGPDSTFNFDSFSANDLFHFPGPFSTLNVNNHRILVSTSIMKKHGFEKFTSGGYSKWRRRGSR